MCRLQPFSHRTHRWVAEMCAASLWRKRDGVCVCVCGPTGSSGYKPNPGQRAALGWPHLGHWKAEGPGQCLRSREFVYIIFFKNPCNVEKKRDSLFACDNWGQGPRRLRIYSRTHLKFTPWSSCSLEHHVEPSCFAFSSEPPRATIEGGRW